MIIQGFRREDNENSPNENNPLTYDSRSISYEEPPFYMTSSTIMYGFSKQDTSQMYDLQDDYHFTNGLLVHYLMNSK